MYDDLTKSVDKLILPFKTSLYIINVPIGIALLQCFNLFENIDSQGLNFTEEFAPKIFKYCIKEYCRQEASAQMISPFLRNFLNFETTFNSHVCSENFVKFFTFCDIFIAKGHSHSQFFLQPIKFFHNFFPAIC